MTKEKLKQEAEEFASKGGLPKEKHLFGVKVIAYLAGAEPREKQIAELEKENERITVAYNNCVRDNYYKVTELEKEKEKENAELKEKLKPENCLKLLAKEGYIKFTSDQLAKAKEIVKILLHKLIMAKAPYKTDLTEDEIAEIEKLIGDSEVEK